MTQSLSIEQKQSALRKIVGRLKPIGKYGAQLAMYATALGALATIGGANLASTPFNILVGSVGFNLLSNIIERVAKDEHIDDDVLQAEVEFAIQKSDLEKLLTKDDFYRAIAKIVRSQDKILSTAKSSDVDIRRLVHDVELLIEVLRDDSPKNISALPNITGITWSYPIWNELPDLSEFAGRDAEIKELEKSIKETKRVIIYGISGTGKSLIAAKLAENLKASGFSICWISLNTYLEFNDVKAIIVNFFFDNGMKASCNRVQTAEPATFCQVVVDELLENKICLFFDSFNSANQTTRKIIEDILSLSINFGIQGGILISSTYLPNCYSQVDISKGKIIEFGLAGFSFAETVDMFKSISVPLSQDDIFDFYEAVGGHPMSVTFLLQLIQNASVTATDIQKLKKQGVEASRDWLFSRVFSTLSNDEQEIILALSIFDYAFEDKEVDLVYLSSVRPQFSLMPLIKRHFVHYAGDKYVLHEAIRSLSYEMITPSEREKLHRKVSNSLYEEVSTQLRSAEGVELELGYKWSYHLENLSDFLNHEQTIKRLLTLDNNHLSALLAIAYYGYPFDFQDESLETSKMICESLIAKKWIKKNVLGFKKPAGPVKVKRQYLPIGLKPIDIFFLSCLCRRRGIADSMGYFDMPEENFAFYKQGLLCQWEHCIELYPLLQERNETSCPVFGHCCPGGSQQVEICSEIFKD